MAVPIPSLSKSIYSDVSNVGYRKTFDDLAAKLAMANNWFARKKVLFDTLQALEIVIGYENLTAQEAGEKVEEAPRDEYLQVVPYVIGGILEQLAEREISSAEQAAFYMLSAHPEHQEAAERWLEANPKHMKAFKKFVKSNRYYRKILEEGADTYGDG
jgi:hypothetical protein